MTIMSRHPSEEYRRNWEMIFRPLYTKCDTCKIKVTCAKLKKEQEVCKHVQIIQCDTWVSKMGNKVRKMGVRNTQ